MPTAIASFISIYPQSGFAADASVSFDFAKAHAFGGFGLQIWNLPQNFEALTGLLKTLAVGHVRIGSFPPPAQAELTGKASVQSIVQALRRSATSSQIDRWSRLGRQLTQMNIDVHFVNWQIPPIWRKVKSWTDKQGHSEIGNFADTIYIKSYADYICAQVLFAQSLGISVRFVELSNEPNGSWDTAWAPADYARLVVVTRRALDSVGLSRVGIEGPGTSTERDAGPYLAALKESGAYSSLEALSVHDWDTRIAPDPVGLSAAFLADARSVPEHLPIYITEMNDEAKRWETVDAIGSGKSRFATDSRSFALALTAELLKSVYDGAEVSIIWEAEDLRWEKAYLGLLDEQGRPKPTVSSFMTFFPEVKDAIQVASGNTSNPQLLTLAFLSNKNIVLVVLNADEKPQKVLISFSHAPISVGRSILLNCFSADEKIPSKACAQVIQVASTGVSLIVAGSSVATTVLAAATK